MKVKTRTDELGAFQEVINWKELRDYIIESTKLLKEETEDIPNMDKFIKELKGMYSTKASIELGTLKELQQYYTFHGGKYKFGEDYSSNLNVANLYGGDPFDTEVTVWLSEVDPENNDYVIRMQQSVDSEQLTNATFDYLKKMAKTLKTPMPNRDEFPALTHDTWTASRIHGSGWVIYSIETKEVMAEGVISVEERIIEIQ